MKAISSERGDRRRLLFVLPTKGRGGAEDYALTVAQGALSNWDVAVAMPQTRGTAELGAEFAAIGVRLHDLSSGGANCSWFSPRIDIFRDGWRLAHVLRRERPDVVHLVLPTPFLGLGVQIAAASAGCPTLLTFQLVPESLSASPIRRILASLLRRRQRWVAVSDHNRHELARLFDVQPDSIELIPNGTAPPNGASKDFEVQGRSRRELCESLGLRNDSKLLLTAARLTPQKGHADLIAAIPAVLQRHADAHFLWAGDGPLEEKLLEDVRAAGIGRHVHLLGRRDDIPRLLQAADLFVFPTRYEGQPFAVLEAMAHHLPVVSTSASGIAELITNGVHGLLSRPGDPAALSANIIAALSSSGRCQTMAAAAAVRIREFSKEMMVQRTLDALSKLAATNSSGKSHGATPTGKIARLFNTATLRTDGAGE